MKRLVTTSRGTVQIEVDRHFVTGLALAVTLFDEAGWETTTRGWTKKDGYDKPDITLGAFFASFIGLPEDEADAAVSGRRAASSGGRASHSWRSWS